VNNKIVWLVLGIGLFCICLCFGIVGLSLRAQTSDSGEAVSIDTNETLPLATPEDTNSAVEYGDQTFSLDNANTVAPNDILEEVLFMPGGGDQPVPPRSKPAFMRLPETEPKMYLEGFEPDEHIRVFAYKHMDGHDVPYTVTLVGWKEYKVDSSGKLEIDLPGGWYYYIVVGEFSGLVQPPRPLMLESPLK